MIYKRNNLDSKARLGKKLFHVVTVTDNGTLDHRPVLILTTSLGG